MTHIAARPHVGSGGLLLSPAVPEWIKKRSPGAAYAATEGSLVPRVAKDRCRICGGERLPQVANKP